MFRDSAPSKAVMAVFDKLYQRHSKKISVSAQNSELLDDHLLPMMQIIDKQNQNILCQVFNFVDHMGGPTQDVQGKWDNDNLI